MIRVLLCSFLFLAVSISSGQGTESILRQQLVERNIEEQVFLSKLRERGVTYGSLDEIPPAEYPELELVVNEILEEIERENTAAQTQQQLKPPEEDLPPSPVLTESSETDFVAPTTEELISVADEALKGNLPPVKIYGQEIFRNQTLQVYRQADNIRPRDNYLLGPGDEITVSIWGVSIFERTYIINENGYINPVAMPRIYLKDMTFKNASEKLRRSFAAFNRFERDQFEVSLRYSRSLSIGMFGEVFNPGNYTISAMNSAFNALVAAGGPTDIGSLRKIKWIRSNGQVEIVDVYKYMSDPTIIDKYYLSENDIIQIPLAERIVSISGSVNRPMRYELIEGEELMSLIDYAGGLAPDAYREVIQLKRFEDDSQKIYDIPLKDLMAVRGDFLLKHGDQISIRKIPIPIRNYVSVTGTVELPGQYEFRTGMRLTDLLDKGMLKQETERTFAVLRRTNRDGTSDFIRINLEDVLADSSSTENVTLQVNDQLQLFDRKTYIDQYQVSISGSIRNPGDFEFDPSQSMTIRDVVLMAGGLTAESTDFAYLIRRSLDTNQPEYIPINIREIMSNPASTQNITIQPKDRINIQSKRSFIEEATISINGAVRSPGTFEYDESITIKDLVVLANGLRLEAQSDRIEVSRIIIDKNIPTKVVIAQIAVDENYELQGTPDFELQPYDEVFVRSIPEFEFQKKVSITGEVKYPGGYTIIEDKERLTDLLRRAGGLTVEAFPEGATLVRSYDGIGPIVIELDKAIDNEKFDGNLYLREGDRLNIPAIKDFVSLSGAIKTPEVYREDLISGDNKVTVIFDGEKSARYYIQKFAGGFANNSDRAKVTVEYPNGIIKESKDFGLFTVYPRVRKGSRIDVGPKDPKEKKEDQREEKEPIDWAGVLADAVAQATTVLTLILLIDRAGR